MPLSSHLAPGFIRLTYSGTRNPHHQVIPVKFADTDPTPGIEPVLLTSTGVSVNFSTAISNYVQTVFKTLFPSSVKIGSADVYKVSATTGIRTWLFAHTLGVAGTNTNAQVAHSEAVFTFKTTVGALLKVYVMEGVYAADLRNVGVVPADTRQDVIDYILSADNIFYGREDSWPLAFRAFTSKVNDVLRKNGGFTDV